MPTAPRYPGSQIQTGALPQTRVPVGAPLAAFGGGEAVAGAFGQARGLAQDELRRQAEVANKEKHHALSLGVTANRRQLTSLRADIEDQISKMQLGDALEAPDVMEDLWGKGTQSLKAGIKDQDLQFQFDQDVAGEYESLFKGTRNHVARESEKFDAAEYEGLIGNILNDTARHADDNDALVNNRSKLLEEFEARADRTDVSGQARDAARTQLLSAFHASVIRSRLAAGNDLSAEGYFKGIRQELTGETAIALEGALQQGSRQEDAYRIVEEAMSGPPPKTEREYMVRVKQALEGKDGKTKMMTEVLAGQRWNREAGMVAEEGALFFQDTWNQVRKTGQLPPADVMDRLSQRQQEEILSALKPKEDSDRGFLTDILGARKEDLLKKYPTPAQFFDGVKAKLSEKHFDRALEYYQSAVNANADKAKQVRFDSQWLTEREILRYFKMTGVGGVTSQTPKDKITSDATMDSGLNQFRDEAEAIIRSLAKTKNDRPDDVEINEKLRDLALTWNQTVTKLTYPLGVGSFERQHEGYKIGKLTEDELDNSILKMPWAVRQELHNRALHMRIIPQGTSLKKWEDENRGRVNRAFVAGMKNASDADVEKILSGIP